MITHHTLQLISLLKILYGCLTTHYYHSILSYCFLCTFIFLFDVIQGIVSNESSNLKIPLHISNASHQLFLSGFLSSFLHYCFIVYFCKFGGYHTVTLCQSLFIEIWEGFLCSILFEDYDFRTSLILYTKLISSQLIMLKLIICPLFIIFVVSTILLFWYHIIFNWGCLMICLLTRFCFWLGSIWWCCGC